MAIDGVFINYLVKEVKPLILNKRINKILMINDNEYVFVLSHNLKLLLSVNPNNPHFRITQIDYLNGSSFLSTFLKHHIENGIILDLYQHHNDRIVTFVISRSDELGYTQAYHLHLELTGRSANMIITDGEIILEALKKGFLNDGRILQTKVKYAYPVSNQINPYTNNDIIGSNFEGVSKTLEKEFEFTQNIDKVIHRTAHPVIITNKKIEFYVFDLNHLEGSRQFFDSISEMLEYYFIETMKQTSENNEQKHLLNLVNREITKLLHKLDKQEKELSDANDNLKYEKIGNILSANIHLVKPYQEEIKVYNFYDDEDIIISLNTKIPPRENINFYFNKYKKAKRGIKAITEAIEKTKYDIEYYKTLLTQMDNINARDLKEIMIEVGVTKAPKRQEKPKIINYIDQQGNNIYVGKNNIQNNYLTHTLANKNDYFFHVKAYPGSHVIFRGNLDDEAINLAATIAATFSKANGKVSVDYTQVKWVKKVKGQLGSFVTYTNQKSIVVSPDLEFINTQTTLGK